MQCTSVYSWNFSLPCWNLNQSSYICWACLLSSETWILLQFIHINMSLSCVSVCYITEHSDQPHGTAHPVRDNSLSVPINPSKGAITICVCQTVKWGLYSKKNCSCLCRFFKCGSEWLWAPLAPFMNYNNNRTQLIYHWPLLESPTLRKLSMYNESDPPEYRGKKCVCAHAWSLEPETIFNAFSFKPVSHVSKCMMHQDVWK